MGIVIGIAEILLGLYELWTGAKFSRLPLHQKIKGLYSLGFVFIGCGCFSVLICALTSLQNSMLDTLTWLAEMGVLLLYGSFRDIHRLRSCKLEVRGVFSHFSPVLGMMPVFTYKVGKQQYRETSQPCSMEKYRAQLRTGETYTIFVNEARPSIFVFRKKIERSNYFLTIPLGVVLVVPWMMYCGYLLTN